MASGSGPRVPIRCPCRPIARLIKAKLHEMPTAPTTFCGTEKAALQTHFATRLFRLVQVGAIAGGSAIPGGQTEVFGLSRLQVFPNYLAALLAPPHWAETT